MIENLKEVHKVQKKYLSNNEKAEELSADEILNSLIKQITRNFGY